jgi:hypothetical protein
MYDGLINMSAFAELLDNSLDEVCLTAREHSSSFQFQILMCSLSAISLQGCKWSYLCEH